MSNLPVPSNEAQRLGSLHALGIMYTAAEERFDRITRMASRLLGTPIALVSLVDERCQWFKSAQGLAATETSREVSFCSHAVLQDSTFVVEDATKDERFADNPLVTGHPDIRSYAGQPVYTADGMPIGTLCVIGTEPRSFAQPDLDTLRDLAKLVEGELQREELSDGQRKWLVERDELVSKASVDNLTRAWNRATIMELFAAELGRAGRGTPLCVAMLDIDKFKNVNDTFGHPTGDRVIAETAACIRGAVRDFDVLGRYGGEEFLLLLGNCPENEALVVCERIRSSVAALSIVSGHGVRVPVTISIGVAPYSRQLVTAAALIDAADRALYRAKESGRNRVEPA
jgi:diguanylate cyclase (GGDEF)-like protein